MRILAFIFLLLIGLNLAAQPISKKRLASQYAKEGFLAEGKGNHKAALSFYAKALQHDTKNQSIALAKARTLFQLKDFQKALKLLQPLLKSRKLSQAEGTEAIQLYAGSLDILGKPAAARKALKNGLKKYPEAGPLYLEFGLVDLTNGNSALALLQWERGIRKVPDYALNYWMAAKALQEKGDLVWAAIYYEQYLSLDPYSERATASSQGLWACYEQAWQETSHRFRFHQDSIPGSKRHLHEVYDQHFAVALPAGTVELDIQGIFLCLLDACDQLRYYSKAAAAQPYFEWLAQVQNAGHLKAYVYWLFQNARPADFANWTTENPTEFANFESWFPLNNFLQFTGNPLIRPLER